MSEKSFTQTIIVNESQTASQFGSGLLPVFATPALIALMENTAMQLIELPEGSSSVGISINMQHLKANLVGSAVYCKATITAIEGRKYSFYITATNENGDLLGECIHERMVINVEKFMSKAMTPNPLTSPQASPNMEREEKGLKDLAEI